MFVRDFQAFGIAAICLANGYLAAEGIECWQVSLLYLESL